jgi:dTDP-4-dehydrorhamnose 3,5-epimerase
MRFETLPVHGTVCVRIEPREDSRGLFARTFCVEEFAGAGLITGFVQASTSFSSRRGTVRGMHFQWPPSREGKLVRCVRGAVFDVVLDLRPDSPSYLRHAAIVLDQENRDAVFIPPGVAHGFQTLDDASEVLYQMTDFYAPSLAAGYRWNDPVFGIEWPVTSGIVISARDAQYPDFDRQSYEAELHRRQQ